MMNDEQRLAARDAVTEAMVAVTDVLSAPSIIQALNTIHQHAQRIDELMDTGATVNLDPVEFAQQVAFNVDTLAMARESARAQEVEGVEELDDRRIRVQPDSVLQMEDRDEHWDIELERLTRISDNASFAAGRLFAYIKYGDDEEWPEDVFEKVTKSAAMRYAATLRDSLKAMRDLLSNGAPLPDGIDEDRGDRPLLLAEIYNDLKVLKKNYSLPSIVEAKIDRMMRKISG
jgi:hypothetical protein